MENLIECMPNVAELVMNRCITIGVCKDDNRLLRNKEYLEFDYELINVDKKKFNHPLYAIAKSENEMLLNHPLTLALLRKKWFLSAFFYFAFLINYTLFLLCFNMVLLKEIEGCKSFWKIALLLLASIGFLFEFLQFFVNIKQKQRYFKFDNILDLSTYAASIFIYFDIRKSEIGSIGVLLTWINLILYLRKFSTIGICVSMILEIFKSFIKFVFVFLLFIIAFACTFQIAFHQTDLFKQFSTSILKVDNPFFKKYFQLF